MSSSRRSSTPSRPPLRPDCPTTDCPPNVAPIRSALLVAYGLEFSEMRFTGSPSLSTIDFSSSPSAQRTLAAATRGRCRSAGRYSAGATSEASVREVRQAKTATVSRMVA